MKVETNYWRWSEWVDKLTTENNALKAENARLLAACKMAERDLDVLADKLAAKVRPGHIEYLSKDGASQCATRTRDELRAAIALAGKDTE